MAGIKTGTKSMCFSTKLATGMVNTEGTGRNGTKSTPLIPSDLDIVFSYLGK